MRSRRIYSKKVFLLTRKKGVYNIFKVNNYQASRTFRKFTVLESQNLQILG